jgi:hypothetical protein
MAIIIYKNTCEYMFLIWISQYPESFHPLDMERFYIFAKNVARYRAAKWLNYSYFKEKILLANNNFNSKNIEVFHEKLLELVEFHKAGIDEYMNGHFDKREGYFQKGVKNGKIYEIAISKKEYHEGKANKNSLKSIA